MNIYVDGNNFFHTGWLARFLGLPRTPPRPGTMGDAERDAWLEGWDICNETSTADRIEAYYRMLAVGHVVAVWVDDDNENLGPDDFVEPYRRRGII
jgi:hypothetical protein